ncbi:MAG: ABC transporter permease [Candidatus Rokuibacteriota bacterium]|nr:MAG: ABC transporter permease [Candidatus Rokubacteria bacterium]
MTSKALWAVVTAVLAVLVLLPLGWLVVKSVHTEAGLSLANYTAIAGQTSFRAATVNSLVFGVAASLIGLVLGAPMAWAVSRTNMPLRGVVRAGVLGAFVTPGFVLAVAWILLAGPNAGLLNKLWIALTGASRGILDVYTMTGLVLVSVASTFPLAFLLVYNTLEMMSSDVEEAARVLGAGTARVTWTVTLPLALPAIVASVILMFLETIILYGVPAMIGVPARIYVLTTQLFSLFEWPPRIGLAAAISLPLLLVTAALLVIQRRLLARRSFATNRGKGGRRRLVDLGALRWVAFALCGLVLLFTLVLPYAVIVWASVSKVWVRALASASFTLDHYRFVLFEFTSGSQSIWNSLVTAVIAATIGVVIAVIVAYLAERRIVRHAGLLSFLAMAPLVIPGMVFAVGLFAAYSQRPVVLYGTLWILMLAYLTKFLPFAYMSCHAAVQSVYPELEHAANVLGASRARALRDITVPMIKAGLLGGWILIFIPAIKELSSSILLFTAPTTVIATAIIDLYQLPSWEGVAALSTILLVLNGVVIAAGNWALGGNLLGRPGGSGA